MAETNSAVKFYRTTSSAFSSATKEDGALYFLTDVGKIYLVVGTGSSQSLYQMSVSPSDIVSNVAQGDGNGQIKVTKNGSASNVSVKGLKSAAYTESTDYATFGHTHDTRYVRFDTNSQGLTSTQKSNARTNIGAGTSSFSGSYNDLTNKPYIPSKDSDITNDQYVRYDTASQGLTSTQKSNARTNIGAGTSSFSGSYSDLSNKPSIPSKDSDLSTNDRYVRFDTSSQGLSSTQKSNARTNIGAGTSSFSGSYNDLSNKPTIPAAQVNSDWNASSGVAQILNKPALAKVATSGSYNDLSNKPTIPTDTNQKIKAGSVTFGNNDVVDIVAGDNVTVTGLASGTGAPKITISSAYTDTGATSVETTGSGNVVNSASYDATTRKLTLSKGFTAATSGHTHTLSLASDSGTSIIDLQSNTKYKLTAGGSTLVFKTPAGGSGGSTLYRHNLEFVFKTGSSSSGYIYTHFYAYLITNSSTAYTYSAYFGDINTLFKKTVLCGGLYDYSSQEEYGYDGISTEWQPNYSKSGNLNGVYIRYMRESSSTWGTSTYITSSTIAYSFTDTVETL